MSELVPEYTRQDFPYAGILNDLTMRVPVEKMGPIEAYLAFLNERDAHHLDPCFDYLSTPITTGGHADNMEGIAEVIRANTGTAQRLTTILGYQGSIVGRRTVLAVDLGKTGWEQSEFMTFWGLVIAGPDLRELKHDAMGFAHFENDLRQRLATTKGFDLNSMDNHLIERDDRRPYYDQLMTVLAKTIMSANVSCRPADHVVSLADPDISLGCWAEQQLADALDIPTRRLAAILPATSGEALSMPVLRDDMKVTMANGMQSVVAFRGSCLTLVAHEMFRTF